MFSRDLSSSSAHESQSITYNIIATIIFIVVSLCFFVPCNRLIPLDRRSAAILGATLCYATRSFLFPQNKMDLVEAVDFDVLALLAGIMAINFIMIHQRETKGVIRHVQMKIQENPQKGYWLVCVASFIVSPFLTNDGVCLLFVEPILNAFDSIERHDDMNEIRHDENSFMLEKGDSFYFLLGLACSANIGSSLTYTGNPQNMIVAQDAIDVLPPYKFLLYMILPAVITFYITISWIEREWYRNRNRQHLENRLSIINRDNDNHVINVYREDEDAANPMQANGDAHNDNDTTIKDSSSHMTNSKPMLHLVIPDITLPNPKSRLSPHTRLPDTNVVSMVNHGGDGKTDISSPRKKKSNTILKSFIKIIITPFPYAMLILMAIMIAMIFVDLISIAGLICITAVIMVVVLVLGNHWQGLPIFGHAENDGSLSPVPLQLLTAEEKMRNTEEFFEELFSSLDYNLLLIFFGLFVVVENVASTGIPKNVWSKIVGKTPFDTASSVIYISIFVLLVSQFLGNVAVIQLAVPNIEPLDNDQKKFAWAVISFVATVGGNLTITGSAANIIVAEKAVRIDPASRIDFMAHFRVCFLVTLFSCVLGGVMITGICICENSLRW